MNRAEKFAIENRLSNVATRSTVQTSIRRHLAKWNLLTHIHVEIAPKLAELVQRDALMDSIGHIDREAKTRPMNYKDQLRNGDFYSTGVIDNTNLAAENNPVFATIEKIKAILRESKQASAIV